MARSLLPGQLCRILVVDAATGAAETVFESDSVLAEAPNWSPDGEWLLVNADGGLWRLPADPAAIGGGVLSPIEMRGVPEINNDHVIAPDGALIVSARDGHLYEVPARGGEGRRITGPHPEGRGYKNYLHGCSPDGALLSVVVGSRPTAQSGPEEWQTNIALVARAGGETTLLTDDAPFDDGAELSPDGAWVWFSTERFTEAAGHMQLARMRVDGSDLRRVDETETVDWFPHPSPDDTLLLSLSYPPGTLGHPENRDVVVRMHVLDDGAPRPSSSREVLRLFGGQGALNVNGWAPDSTRFAVVDYPVG